MKITFLGTNGWYSTPTGDTPCILIDATDQYVILDAGNGIYKLEEFIKEDKPIALFISHFHIDHTSGLHTLVKFNFKQGIDVYVGAGRTKDFMTLVNPPFTIGYEKKPENILQQKTEIRLHELPEEKAVNLPYKVEAIKLHHGYIDHGYKFELEGKTIAYTGDCGFTDQAKKLAKGADLLICECSNKKTEQPDIWGHLDPFQAGGLAKESGVKQLILTHFGAHLFTTLEDREWAEREAKKIFPATISAIDGMEFIL
ncbi:MBL fold metallo-hydrolase [Patescibacteria group bacterium]|nr:MBL fold metallo-hydrolase [Patescibacteria group bacterium]MBU4098117.1 MBL fold metallo-hydrolase [Patescibacteria group bacterium]